MVTNGRYKPLEVFHTGDSRGFGVWSPEKIYEGDFICEYVGEILVRNTNYYHYDYSYAVVMITPLGKRQSVSICIFWTTQTKSDSENFRIPDENDIDVFLIDG